MITSNLPRVSRTVLLLWPAPPPPGIIIIIVVIITHHKVPSQKSTRTPQDPLQTTPPGPMNPSFLDLHDPPDPLICCQYQTGISTMSTKTGHHIDHGCLQFKPFPRIPRPIPGATNMHHLPGCWLRIQFWWFLSSLCMTWICNGISLKEELRISIFFFSFNIWYDNDAFAGSSEQAWVQPVTGQDESQCEQGSHHLLCYCHRHHQHCHHRHHHHLVYYHNQHFIPLKVGELGTVIHETSRILEKRYGHRHHHHHHHYPELQ